MRSLIPIGLLLVCIATASARIGFVRTSAGEQLEGHVRFTKQGLTVVNSLANFVRTVPATNVAEVSFPLSATVSDDPSDFGAAAEGWRDIEIGNGHAVAPTLRDRSAFVVRGAGAGIDGEMDSFHYTYQSVKGDREIIARVSMIQHTTPDAKAGIMMRESLRDDARAITFSATAQRGGSLQARHFEARETQTIAQPDVRVGTWLKLRRRGNAFSAYKSVNGRQWTLVETITVPMREDYLVGLAVASGRPDVLCWSRFDRVREGVKLNNDNSTPQVELVSGSVIAGRPRHADQRHVEFAANTRVVPIPTAQIARVVYQPSVSQFGWQSQTGRPGVWVQSGDFFEGEFQQIDGDKLKVSSVLYGIRTFDVDEEVAAVVLGPSKRGRPAVEVDTQDGTRFLGMSFAFAEGELVLRESALGEVRLPAFQIRELRVH